MGSFVIAVLALVLTPVVVVVLMGLREFDQRDKMSRDVAVIRCRRCNHEGQAKIVFLKGRGLTPICSKCRGEDWVKADGPPDQQ
jgi:hypothetical protein